MTLYQPFSLFSYPYAPRNSSLYTLIHPLSSPEPVQIEKLGKNHSLSSTALCNDCRNRPFHPPHVPRPASRKNSVSSSGANSAVPV
eukprot:Awhi_evm1s12290